MIGTTWGSSSGVEEVVRDVIRWGCRGVTGGGSGGARRTWVAVGR